MTQGKNFNKNILHPDEQRRRWEHIKQIESLDEKLSQGAKIAKETNAAQKQCMTEAFCTRSEEENPFHDISDARALHLCREGFRHGMDERAKFLLRQYHYDVSSEPDISHKLDRLSIARVVNVECFCLCGGTDLLALQKAGRNKELSQNIVFYSECFKECWRISRGQPVSDWVLESPSISNLILNEMLYLDFCYFTYWHTKLCAEMLDKAILEALEEASQSGHTDEQIEETSTIALRRFSELLSNNVIPALQVALCAEAAQSSLDSFVFIASQVKGQIDKFPHQNTQRLRIALSKEGKGQHQNLLQELIDAVAMQGLASLTFDQLVELPGKVVNTIVSGLQGNNKAHLNTSVATDVLTETGAERTSIDLEQIPIGDDQVDPIQRFHTIEEARSIISENLPKLTDKEQQVCALKFVGMTQHEIAANLNIGFETVNELLDRARERVNGKRPPSRDWRKAHDLPQRRKRAS